MKNIFYFIRLLFNLMRVARNAENTQAALDIARCLNGMGLLETEFRVIAMDPAGAHSIKNRILMKKNTTLEELSKMPSGTLAQTYANYMISQNLTPDFYDNIEIVNDATYIMMRMRETHDLWHVLTGFKTDVPGELGLQAFMFAQIRTPLAPILICGRCLVSTFKNPSEVFSIFEEVAQGWLMGRRAKPIFSLDWEANWFKQLSELRKEYNVYRLAPDFYEQQLPKSEKLATTAAQSNLELM